VSFWDLFGSNSSENERKRDEYSKLVKYLNKKIPKAEELYNNLNTGCDIEFKIMEGNTNDKTNLNGVLVTMYDEKFKIYRNDTINLLTYYKNMIASFRNKLSVAQSKYEYYVEQCRLDEERKRREEQERAEREREERERAAAQKTKAAGK
jgi:hypothetical protein